MGRYTSYLGIVQCYANFIKYRLGDYDKCNSMSKQLQKSLADGTHRQMCSNAQTA